MPSGLLLIKTRFPSSALKSLRFYFMYHSGLVHAKIRNSLVVCWLGIPVKLDNQIEEGEGRKKIENLSLR